MDQSLISPPDTSSQADVKSIAFGLSTIAVVLPAICFWLDTKLNVFLFQSFHAVAFVLPWLAVWMQARWPEQINIVGGKKDPRPTLGLAVVGSGMCLALTQCQNLQIQDPGYLAIYAIAPTAVLACAFIYALPADRRLIGAFFNC